MFSDNNYLLENQFFFFFQSLPLPCSLWERGGSWGPRPDGRAGLHVFVFSLSGAERDTYFLYSWQGLPVLAALSARWRCSRRPPTHSVSTQVDINVAADAGAGQLAAVGAGVETGAAGPLVLVGGGPFADANLTEEPIGGDGHATSHPFLAPSFRSNRVNPTDRYVRGILWDLLNHCLIPGMPLHSYANYSSSLPSISGRALWRVFYRLFCVQA